MAVDTLTIITNNVPRDIVHAYELPIKVRDDFDYLDWTAIEMGEANAEFVQYKGEWYDINDMMSTHGVQFDGSWDAYISDSFFSGILLRYAAEESEQVIMGRYYC